MKNFDSRGRRRQHLAGLLALIVGPNYLISIVVLELRPATIRAFVSSEYKVLTLLDYFYEVPTGPTHNQVNTPHERGWESLVIRFVNERVTVSYPLLSLAEL